MTNTQTRDSMNRTTISKGFNTFQFRNVERPQAVNRPTTLGIIDTKTGESLIAKKRALAMLAA